MRGCCTEWALRKEVRGGTLLKTKHGVATRAEDLRETIVQDVAEKLFPSTLQFGKMIQRSINAGYIR